MKRAYFLLFGLLVLALSGCLPIIPVTGSGEVPTPVVDVITDAPDDGDPRVSETATSRAATATLTATPKNTDVPVVDPVWPTVTPPATVQPLPDSLTFDQRLARAVESRNLTEMRGLMRNRFSFATLNTSLYEYSADESIAMLQSGLFAPGATPAVIWGTDLVTLLSGADPLALWGPVANVVRAMQVRGLGPRGAEEAVLVIGRDAAAGQRYFHGVLISPDGYFHSTPPTRQPADAVPTDVTVIHAVQEVNVRSGPGLDYAVEGMLRWGETAQVTGKSLDGHWWQILCVTDASGRCWVSANPSYTLPGGGDNGSQVGMIRAIGTINVRSGPGMDFTVEGVMQDGQTAQVTGKSADGNWWQIVCVTDASGTCWISADPSDTVPIGLP